MKFVPKGLVKIFPSLVRIMVRRRPGDKPLSEPMMVSLLTHTCVTRPQWVKFVLIIAALFQQPPKQTIPTDWKKKNSWPADQNKSHLVYNYVARFKFHSFKLSLWRTHSDNIVTFIYAWFIQYYASCDQVRYCHEVTIWHKHLQLWHKHWRFWNRTRTDICLTLTLF